jgi:phospholipid transport system transporter-binding protein
MLTLPKLLTHNAAADFTTGLKALVGQQPDQVVADASALETFDSSALAVLLACRREALAVGKTFAVRGLTSRLRQLSSLYGVDKLLPEVARDSRSI